MLPSEITATEATGQAVPAAPEPLGQEDFLRMLIAQLENQDPLNPQDATEFTAQLAQFSSLEQLISMRTAVEELTSAQGVSQALSAASLIGREVLAETNNLEIPADGELPTIFVDVPSGGGVNGVELLDANGALIARTSEFEPVGAGTHEISWSDFDSTPPEGVYAIRVLEGATSAPARTLVEARVTGASVEGVRPVLLVGEAVVPLSSVLEIRE
ncbi:MAG: flagellar hook assembly protein FlgD [Myxococcota bacterium]